MLSFRQSKLPVTVLAGIAAVLVVAWGVLHLSADLLLEIGRYVLSLGLVLANVAVWYGVYLERDSAPPEVQHRGWRILIYGLAAETTLGFLLFVVDSAISVRLSKQLSTAQTTAANAVREAARLGVRVETLPTFVDTKVKEIDRDIADFQRYAQNIRDENSSAIARLKADEAILTKQLTDTQKVAAELKVELAQESALRAKIAAALAPREITDAQLDKIATALKPFAGQQWEVTPYWEMKESLNLANRIYAALGRAQWVYMKPQRGSMLLGGITGVLVYSHPEASATTRAAAIALVKELNAIGIVAESRDKNNPGHPDELITLNVGSKQ